MICIDLLTKESVDHAAPTFPNTVLALGNFDGVHIGHRALLEETVLIAKRLSSAVRSVAPGVWLFRDPPSDTLRDPPIPHLYTLEEKLTLFGALGIRYAFLGDFRQLGSISPQEFTEVLQKDCRCIHAICGFNYSFGHHGKGTPALLKELLHGSVSEIPPVLWEGAPVSSTRIRHLLTEGDVKTAAQLLGRPYSFTLPVIHGKALGRTIDFPTLNQCFPPLTVIPKSGIYAVTVRFPWERFPTTRYGIANIGVRPTVESTDRINCETYILDFSGDLYGKDVEIGFVERLRDERKMSDINELKKTIRGDEEKARRIFGL